MKKRKTILALLLAVSLLFSAIPAYAATGKVSTRNVTNIFDAYSSTSKTWNELKTARHMLDYDNVVYCLQHKKSVPNPASYELTDLMSNYSAKIQTGLQIILENGYPWENGGLTTEQAEYATANAIRFWLSECGDSQFYNMTNLGDFSDSELRSLAAAGTITKKIRTNDDAYIPALQFSIELLIKARAQATMTHSVYASPSSVSTAKSGSYFTGSASVYAINLNGGYEIDTSGLPAGSSVNGYTGSGGDVLSISIPASESTASQTYAITLTGLDDRVLSNMRVYNATDTSYQRVLVAYPEVYEPVATTTLYITTPAYETPKPDLIISALTASKSSCLTGETILVSATVKNQGNSAAGTFDVAVYGNSIDMQTSSIFSLAVGTSRTVSFYVTAPSTAQSFNITAYADVYGDVEESNESNNNKTIRVVCVAPTPTPTPTLTPTPTPTPTPKPTATPTPAPTTAAYPDLIVSSLVPSKYSYTAGETMRYTAVIRNQGSAASSSCYSALYSSGFSTQYSSIPALSAGASTTVSFSVTAPSISGTLTITAEADYFEQVTESNESNNTRSISVSVTMPTATATPTPAPTATPTPAPAAYPDLTITYLVSDQDSYETGSAISIMAVIKNQGSVDTEYCYAILEGGGDVYAYVEPLTAGSSTVVSFSLTAPDTAQTLYLTATVDEFSQIDESNESNNSKSISIAITAPAVYPDLTITSLISGQSNYETGSSISITAIIKNQGSIDTEFCYAILEGGEDDVYAYVESLTAGSSTVMSFSLTAPDTAQTLYLTATVDEFSQITESNESNNSKSISIAITAPTPYPDLTITSLTSAQSSYETGASMSFTAVVKNQGNAAASAFYVILEGGSENKYAYVSSLAAGSSTTVSFSLTAPDTAQTLTLTATADEFDQVEESNENNNSRSISVTIYEAAYPDLTVTTVVPSESAYSAGQTVTVYSVIKNAGDADATNFVARFVPQGMSAQTQTVSGLAAGESKVQTWTFTAPVLTSTQSLTLTVTADSSAIILESNENNNVGTGSVTIYGELPDLEVTALSTNAASYAPGDSITVTATVRNNGIVACPQSTLRLSGDDITTLSQTISALATGASKTVTFSFSAPYIIGERQFTILAAADPANSISESDENNNTRSCSFIVSNPLPDLTITQIRPGKDSFDSGESGIISVTVKNNGDAVVTDSRLKLQIGSFHSEVKLTGSIGIGASVQLSFSFTVPEVDAVTSVTVTATADPTDEILEINEDNNTLSTSITIRPVLPDLGITSTNAANWYAGKEVVVTATVVNYTANDAPSVAVRLSIGGRSYEESVPIPGGGSNLAVFRITLPTTPGAATLNFLIDPYDAITEEDEENNTLTRTIQIVAVPEGVVLDPDLAALEEDYKQNGIAAIPDTANSDYHIWQEVRLEGENYVTKTFWARLQTVFNVYPDSRIAYEEYPSRMESGFGTIVDMETILTSNYDHPEKLVGVQMVWTFAPESAYGRTAEWSSVFDDLEPYSGAAGADRSCWQLKVNPWSVSGSRLHYTPLWFPDGQYTLLAQACYAWSPAGQLYWYDADSVDILGDMYDRVTAIQGR